MDNLFNEKSLNNQIVNWKLTSYKKGSVKTLLFDSIPIENRIVISTCRN